MLPKPRLPAVKALAALAKHVTASTLSYHPPRLPSNLPGHLTYVYTSAIGRTEAMLRECRPVQPHIAYNFTDFIAVLNLLHEFVPMLFGKKQSRAQEAAFELVQWVRDLNLELSAVVRATGSTDYVSAKFPSFMDKLRTLSPSDYSPVATASAIFTELTERFGDRKTKAILTAAVAPAAASSSALSAASPPAPTPQQPGGKGFNGGGKGAGKGKGGGKGSQQIPGPGPPGSWWHWTRGHYVRFVEDPASGRRRNDVCFLCGCGSTPGSKGHRAIDCKALAPAVQDWVERAIASV